MAFVSVGIKEPLSFKRTYGTNGKLEGSELWQVIVDSKNYKGPQIEIATGIPKGLTYADIEGEIVLMRVTSKEATPQGGGSNKYVWHVAVDYESIDKEEAPEHPLDKPAEIELDYQEVQELVLFAVNDAGNRTDAIASSAGEPLQHPAPTRTNYIDTLSITKNRAIGHPIVRGRKNYRGRTNADFFWGESAGFWLFCGVKIKRRVEKITVNDKPENIAYLECTYDFIGQSEGWHIYPLDQGTYTQNEMFPELKVSFLTEQGNTYVGQLDGNGQPGGPYYLDFQIYPTANFADLGLPQNFSQ